MVTYKPPLILKTEAELDRMREAGKVAWRALTLLEEAVRPGVALCELDELAERFIRQQGMTPSFKDYAPPFNPHRRYPATLCASVNDQVVHGLPTERKLVSGDIVGLDLGVCCGGYHADTARTVGVGRVGKKARRLMQVTRECLQAAIEKCSVGGRLSDVSRAIQDTAEKNGYQPVRQLTGHGVGRYVHEAPDVPNFVSGDKDLTLTAGMTLAIEPMVNYGGYEVVSAANGWTVSTADGSLSAHYEHTVAVTDDGPVVLTAAPEE